MPHIQLLDDNTIDKIAAGEVVERPSSVVKELIENSMDSGADAITVEIKNGGIEFIRITDNGCGIFKEDIKKAFLRHATSKITSIEDLNTVTSMGFRGEALASIASVAKVELVTKREDDFIGARYTINGGMEEGLEEVGAPTGTTIIVRNLFYNTPARRKFLKSEASEAGKIADIVEHLALCRPDISYTFINNGKTRFQTSGNKNLKEVIYRLYGKETANEVIPVSFEENGIEIQGFLGTPSLNRPSRNYETYFINRRFIHSNIIAKSIEEGYKAYVMQHKFPFCVLHIDMDTSELDVNVHPSKMEVRFHDGGVFHNTLTHAVAKTLSENEMIASVKLEEEKDAAPQNVSHYEPFENSYRAAALSQAHDATTATPSQADSAITATQESTADVSQNQFANVSRTNIANVSQSDSNNVSQNIAESVSQEEFSFDDEGTGLGDNGVGATGPGVSDNMAAVSVAGESTAGASGGAGGLAFKDYTGLSYKKEEKTSYLKITKENQFSIFDNEKVISEKARRNYKIVGQIFKTYWIIEFNDKIYFVDQHAAHEKVNYERIMARVEKNEIYSQNLNPPIIVSLNPSECITLKENLEYFNKIGFEVEEYESSEFVIRAIPMELYFNNPKDLFLEIIADCDESGLSGTPDAITRNIATMACKASVKGGDEISYQEIEELLDELLTLENPYHCPHGRPTIFSMSKYELEKKFKRIVN